MAGTPVLQLLGYLGSKGYEPTSAEIVSRNKDASGGYDLSADFVQQRFGDCIKARSAHGDEA
eukprot:CAMPEP_0177568210 /NCGR_PEP_ID=MMETSP0369-20130122/75637_1 /TAXON_ID=447022 ORGANISM="Scrippsiella hangoei-like, Strain SHHI-4" /NCGR_SAMPLE_ID=MMETSP0369 /ASSEMBLY_ACC=CAM_ASM_000364 /LENGTH=61 /DNA_ID=CAMNT_0019055769 /DNA_START=15 /DNA_END=196 /DNA_ORIENTATION=-